MMHRVKFEHVVILLISLLSISLAGVGCSEEKKTAPQGAVPAPQTAPGVPAAPAPFGPGYPGAAVPGAGVRVRISQEDRRKLEELTERLNQYAAFRKFDQAFRVGETAQIEVENERDIANPSVSLRTVINKEVVQANYAGVLIDTQMRRMDEWQPRNGRPRRRGGDSQSTRVFIPRTMRGDFGQEIRAEYEPQLLEMRLGLGYTEGLVAIHDVRVQDIYYGRESAVQVSYRTVGLRIHPQKGRVGFDERTTVVLGYDAPYIAQPLYLERDSGRGIPPLRIRTIQSHERPHWR